jgi:mono/diheme cytochrome c family protein
VRVFDVQGASLSTYAVREPVAAAFLQDGRLLVAAARSLYLEDAPGGELLRIHTSEEPITGLAVSGSVTWLRIGGALARLDGLTLRRGEPMDAPGEVALHPAQNGDIWRRTDCSLRRFSAGGDEQADQARWEREVQPLFARYCMLCHLPGGSAGIDLSTYRSWALRRPSIDQRVLQGKPSPMPPAGAGVLTAQEKETLKGWVEKK